MVASAAAAARSADVIQHAATTHTERRTFQASRLVTTISVVASATATMTAGCENHRSAAPVIAMVQLGPFRFRSSSANANDQSARAMHTSVEYLLSHSGKEDQRRSDGKEQNSH